MKTIYVNKYKKQNINSSSCRSNKFFSTQELMFIYIK
jgi:hypothetical protein